MANGVKNDSPSFKHHFEDFVEFSEQERRRAEKRRDYRDLKQWTDEEAAAIEERGQAVIVFDQYSKKVDGITGLEIENRTDPKAYPVDPRKDKGADAITAALRYVEGKQFFDCTATDVFEDKIVEGYGGAITEINPETKEIEVNYLPWDRIYFDPYSRMKDFSDSKYFGITVWMDLEEAVKLYPDKEDELKMFVDENQYDDTTFEDRPADWIHIGSGRKRLRINQEYYFNGKQWQEVFYIADINIVDPRPSPYLDCDGNPSCPIELQSDYVDRDNNRWGYMERLIDPQDEINHRRSLALHMLRSFTIVGDKGAFGRMTKEEVLNELKKGDTFIEKIQGTEVEIDNQQELGQTQVEFYRDAQQAMDSVGVNPELTGRTEQAISGRAFLARREGGMLELTRIFSRHSDWKVRIYRQIWARIKQFWTQEKWIRVTDNVKDRQVARFVGLNVPITRVEKMIEQRTGMDIMDVGDTVGGDVLDEFIQMSIQQNPLLGEPVETRNNVAEMHMDIVIEESPDTITQQNEQFQVLAQLAGTRADPLMFEALLKLSNIPNKEDVLEMFKPNEQQQQAQAQAQQQVMDMEMADKAADIESKQADVAKTAAEIQKIMSEILLNQAKTKDEMASAVERVGRTSAIGL